MNRIIIAAALVALAKPAWANPPGYESSWTSKEAADAAITADFYSPITSASSTICGTTQRREGAHQHAEIEPGDMDQIALVDVLASAQPSPTHAAAIEDMGEP